MIEDETLAVHWQQTTMVMHGVTMLIGFAHEAQAAWLAPLGTAPPTQYPPLYESGWIPAGEAARIIVNGIRS